MLRACLCGILLAGLATPAPAETVPSLIETPHGEPPEGAVVLLGPDGTNRFLSKRGGPSDWPLEEGVLVSTRGDVRSNHVVSELHFGDAQIHVEFMLPTPQGKKNRRLTGNSGVYLHGHYELQIFNSFGKKKFGQGDCGAIYGIAPPLVNACRKPGKWQVYDILYLPPQRNEQGKIVQPGLITARLNGRLVQENTRFEEPTSVYHPLRYKTTPYTDKIKKKLMATGAGPVFLQDHDNPVRFRNVWVLPLDDRSGMFDPKQPADELAR